jgi:hypothetical protein
MRFKKMCGLLAVALVFESSAGGQSGEQHRSSLKVYPGFEGVLEAFHRSAIVALPDHHQDSNSSRFRIELISQPKFADTVNDIVIEWGNRLYQKTLDRYIAGDNVPETEVQKIWRNTTVFNGLWDSPGYAEFLLAVRSANSKLPPTHRMRVLAGDPAIDWDKVNNARDYQQFGARRDESVFSVIEQEVLSKHHKALLIMGGGHFRRGVQVNGSTGVVDLLERAHPSIRVFVIGVTPSLNKELKAYAKESFFFTAGSWLEEIASARGMIIYDGVLTLPDGEQVRAPASHYNDPVYSRELNRRWQIVLGRPFDPEKLP